MNEWICECCGRETHISFRCDICGKGVCSFCITFSSGKQICEKCSAAQEKKEE